MGINGFQYIDDSYSCMICNDSCTSSTCADGPRILPWAQDYDDGLNCQGDNEELCSANDDESDVWDIWDINIRDLIIFFYTTISKFHYIYYINFSFFIFILLFLVY